MCEELKRLKRDVRRNEAIIEYMELRGAFTPSMRSIGDITIMYKNIFFTKVNTIK